MPISMSQASAARFVPMLQNLSAVLAKAQAHCEARKIDPLALTSARLYPDMFALTRQVQIACDSAKGAVARLAGIENPKYEDGEKTFEELLARIARTLEFIGGVQPAQIDGSEEKAIVIKLPNRELNFKGAQFLQAFAMPNFYFHITTAYDILRHNGVELGKSDFLGSQ